jgi:hypothetical protein
MKSEAHLQFVKDHFKKDVWVVTEWRDGAVYKTKVVGQVACYMNVVPLRPGKGGISPA